jgi:hypothetical protein
MAAIIGQPAVPISNQVGESKLPKKRARRMHQWVYRWHPKRWHFYKDAGTRGEWLPRLGRISFDAGQSNVQENGNITLAMASAQEQGWSVIRPNDERLGPHQSYMQAVPVEGGGKAYTSRFKAYSIEGGMVFEDFDRQGYYAFLRHLVDAGIVAPMSKNIRSYHLRRHKERVERAEASAANMPHNAMLQARANRLRETHEAMTETYKPKRPGRPKKPKTTEAQA